MKKIITPLRSWIFLGLFLLILVKLFNLAENYPAYMTYRNMDVPGQKNFINYLAPGVKDAISGTKYHFDKKVKIHYKILIPVLLFFFPLMLFLRTYKNLDFKLGVRRWLTGWMTFVIARVGILRVTSVCPVKRSSLGVFPFINCQSCELATGACPVGTFQMALLKGKIPYLAMATVILVGAVLGRWICGWLCPFGFLSDIFDRFSKHKKFPKKAGYIKFVLLGIIIITSILSFKSNKQVLPFCAIVCAGGFFYGLLPYYVTTGFGNLKGKLPFFHVLVLYHIAYAVTFLTLAYRYSGRFFCRYICPMGAVLGLFNKIALVRIEHDSSSCNNCNACNKVCPMGADLCQDSFLDRTNCIACARCVKVCKTGARFWYIDINNLFGKTKFVFNKLSSKISKHKRKPGKNIPAKNKKYVA